MRRHLTGLRVVRLQQLRRLAGMAVLLAAGAVVLSSVNGSLTALATAGNISMSGQIIGVAGKCLDNSGGRTANGNPIVLATCDGSAGQQWTLPGNGTIRNQGHCLAVKHAGTTSMTPVWLYACDGGPASCGGRPASRRW